MAESSIQGCCSITANTSVLDTLPNYKDFSVATNATKLLANAWSNAELQPVLEHPKTQAEAPRPDERPQNQIVANMNDPDR